MPFDFDRPMDRRHSDSTKWRTYDEDVLPLWTADMDFAVPPPVIDALHARVAHGVFGYCVHPPELRDLIAERMWRLYQWRVRPDEVVLQTGVLKAFQLVASLAAGRTDGILVQPPVYPPILGAPQHNGSVHQEAPLVGRPDGRYEIDFDAFEAAITASTRVFILCNPHNPVGRVFRRGELERLAEVCLRHDVLICSDEIHSDLVYPGAGHLPIASLSPEVSRRTVTLMAPSKTFNIPGLRCSFAIVQAPDLRRRVAGDHGGDFADVNNLGLVAATAAYRDGQPWLDDVLRYLESNRTIVVDFVRRELTGVATVAPEATYLAWLDFRQSGVEGDPYEFMLQHARVALSPGPSFGTGGGGFARLNFACPRATLTEALTRMKQAMEGAASDVRGRNPLHSGSR
jgi:cystathionine beta-lyase